MSPSLWSGKHYCRETGRPTLDREVRIVSDWWGLPVVAGFDGSTASAASVDLAVDEAVARVAPLVMVCVVDRLRPPTDSCAPAFVDPTVPWRWRLDAMVAAVREAHPGLAVQAELLVGRPAEVLVERSRDACLVVLGHRPEAGRRVESVATAVARRAAAPVIVHRPLDWRSRPEARPRPVLAGVEATGFDSPVLEFAFLEASLRGTSLTVLHLRTSPVAIPDDGDRLVADAVQRWSQRYPEVMVRSAVRHTLDPAVALAEAARSAQLVVVGAAHRPDGSGSIEQVLADRAGCPVAVVPVGTRSADPVGGQPVPA